MGLIEISGPIYSGMWYYGQPYLDLPVGPVEIAPVEMPEPLKSSLFMEYMTMCSQTGTYLETAAHAVAGRDTIEKVALERAWMVPTVVIHTPKNEREKVTLDDVKAALDRDQLTIDKGDAVLIHTGWDREWRNPERFLDWCPYVSREAWFWIMDQQPSIMGADTPRADSPRDLQNFFGRFFSTDILLLAPVVNLDQVTGSQKPKLVALPLSLQGACASPVRAVLVTD
jgi:kynurenine formamidase